MDREKDDERVIPGRLMKFGLANFWPEQDETRREKSKRDSFWKEKEDERIILGNLIKSGILTYRHGGHKARRRTSRCHTAELLDTDTSLEETHNIAGGPDAGLIDHKNSSDAASGGVERSKAAVHPSLSPTSSLHFEIASPDHDHSGASTAGDSAEAEPRFSKELLISMDHDKAHLGIDLRTPPSANKCFPLQDLSPLLVYRNLHSLTITGMMQSYQSYIWPVVWLNLQLTELTLEMAEYGERLNAEVIATAQRYARSKPTMREVAEGRSMAAIPRRLPIAKLSLTNFAVDAPPFVWFGANTFRQLRLHHCEQIEFCLPNELHGKVEVVVTE